MYNTDTDSGSLTSVMCDLGGYSVDEKIFP